MTRWVWEFWRTRYRLLGCQYRNLWQRRTGSYQLLEVFSCLIHLRIDDLSEARDRELIGPVGVVDDAQGAKGEFIVCGGGLQEESYHFVVVPVAESEFLLVPTPASENATRELCVFEDVHEPVVSEPLGQVEPQLSTEDFELRTVDMLVGDPVPVLLVDIVTDLVSLQLLIVGQKKWSVDLVFDQADLGKIQYRCLCGGVVLLWTVDRKHLRDSVRVSSCVVEASPHDHIIDASREVSVRLLVQIHLCDSVFHHGPIFFGSLFTLPPQQIRVSYGFGLPGQEFHV